jgi:hypothetical protein
VELWWSGCGLVVARVRALVVELRWSGSGVAVDLWWQGQGHFAAVALRQQLCGSAVAVASLAELVAALLKHGIGCGGGSGHLGSGMIIKKSRNNLWV